MAPIRADCDSIHPCVVPGPDITAKFLKQSGGLKRLVRSHECVDHGVQYHHNRKCVTIFSASDYCGQVSQRFIYDLDLWVAKDTNLSATCCGDVRLWSVVCMLYRLATLELCSNFPLLTQTMRK